jgi:hypothetical protein
MSAKDSFNCACNDVAFQIVPTRRRDTWQSQGFWCSTTMTMMNYDGATHYVWNPYSLEELEEKLQGKLEPYMNCIATGSTCTPPSTPVFDRQQVGDSVGEAEDGMPWIYHSVLNSCCTLVVLWISVNVVMFVWCL